MLALFLALLLNRYRKGSNIFKLALYVPLLAPAVLVGLVWQFVTNYDFGLFNLILTNLGVGRVNIFGNATLRAADLIVARRGLARARASGRSTSSRACRASRRSCSTPRRSTAPRASRASGA